MRKDRGFTIIELIVVVAIIGLIAALAVPGLKRARQYAMAGSAIQSLRTITTAEHLYERRFKVYAALSDLVPEGSIDTSLGIGSKSGYNFSITLILDINLKPTRFNCTANPQNEPASKTHFFVDETAVIRYEEGAPATAASPPIPR